MNIKSNKDYNKEYNKECNKDYETNWNLRIMKGLLFLTLMLIPVIMSGCGKKDAISLSELQSNENVAEDSMQQNGVEQAPELSGDVVDNRTDAEFAGVDTDQNVTDADTRETAQCYVHICGAVNQPGVYTVENNARVYEVVAMAGGFREDACTDYLNQAAGVTDGIQIRVPTITEVKENQVQGVDASVLAGSAGTSQGSGTADTSAGSVVNINTATEAELCTLPGIGAQKAASILSYRDRSGGFKSKEDLLKVDGIKTATFQKLKDKIRV